MLFALSILMGCPSSRFHVTTGSGLPVAWHSRETSLPSVRTLSLLLWASSIRGGTEKRIHTEKTREIKNQFHDNFCNK